MRCFWMLIAGINYSCLQRCNCKPSSFCLLIKWCKYMLQPFIISSRCCCIFKTVQAFWSDQAVAPSVSVFVLVTKSAAWGCCSYLGHCASQIVRWLSRSVLYCPLAVETRTAACLFVRITDLLPKNHEGLTPKSPSCMCSSDILIQAEMRALPQ